jgi:hypothetical protein
MADAIQDILSLTQAFGQFSESVTRLHQTRVGMETAAKQSLINKSRYDFLQRFNKPLDDPDRIELDEDSPNYWRKALADHEGQVESYLGSVKNKNVQNAVRQNLSASNQNFAVELSNTLASAEVKETQDKFKVTFFNLVDSGQAENAIAIAKQTQKDLQLFKAADWHKFNIESIEPLEAQVLAGKVVSGSFKETVVDNPAATKEDGTPALREDGTPVESKLTTKRTDLHLALQNLDNMAPTKDMPASRIASARALIQNQMDANDKNAGEDIKRLKAMQEAGEAIPPTVIQAVLDEYEGLVSRGVSMEMFNFSFKANATERIANMDVFTTWAITSLGSKDGVKFINPADGFIALRQLYSAENVAAASTNKDISAALESNASKIRALMAGTTEEKKVIFDTQFSGALAAYKARLMNATQLYTIVMDNAPNLTPEEFTRYTSMIEKNAYNDPGTQDFIKNEKALLQQAYTLANHMGLKDQKDHISKLMSGDPTKMDPWVSRLFKDVFVKYQNAITSGVHMNEGAALKLFNEMVAKELVSMQEGVYKIPEQKSNDVNTHKTYGKVAMDIASGRFMDGGYDVIGHPVDTNGKAEIMKILIPVAVQTVFQAEGKAVSMEGFIPIKGPNGEVYVYHKDWNNTVYKMSGSERGVVMTELKVNGANKSTVQGLVSDGKATFTTGKITANSADYAAKSAFAELGSALVQGWTSAWGSDTSGVVTPGTGAGVEGAPVEPAPVAATPAVASRQAAAASIAEEQARIRNTNFTTWPKAKEAYASPPEGFTGTNDLWQALNANDRMRRYAAMGYTWDGSKLVKAGQ